MIISDVQEPYGHELAVPFCRAVQKEFKIDDENCYHAGDESDLFNFSPYAKTPDAIHTAKTELAALRKAMHPWYRTWPKLKIAESNHPLRLIKKAIEAELPSEVIRSYKEVIGAPEGWIWRPEWLIKDKHPWRLIHGMGYSGQGGHRNAANDAGVSTVIGHLHAHAGIAHIHTSGKRIWGMNVGCLIDVEAYAFDYNKYDRNRPILGCGVVLDHGATPIFVPFERF